MEAFGLGTVVASIGISRALRLMRIFRLTRLLRKTRTPNHACKPPFGNYASGLAPVNALKGAVYPCALSICSCLTHLLITHGIICSEHPFSSGGMSIVGALSARKRVILPGSLSRWGHRPFEICFSKFWSMNSLLRFLVSSAKYCDCPSHLSVHWRDEAE